MNMKQTLSMKHKTTSSKFNSKWRLVYTGIIAALVVAFITFSLTYSYLTGKSVSTFIVKGLHTFGKTLNGQDALTTPSHLIYKPQDQSKSEHEIPDLFQNAAADNILTKHNYYRNLHGVAALTYSTEIAKQAQAYANQCSWAHSQAPGFGENLFATSADGDIPLAAINAWYVEVSKYDFNNPGFSETTGHFTQVVWKATQQMGCGGALCSNMFPGITVKYIVCQYSPPGNVIGSFPENVFPLQNPVPLPPSVPTPAPYPPVPIPSPPPCGSEPLPAPAPIPPPAPVPIPPPPTCVDWKRCH